MWWSKILSALGFTRAGVERPSPGDWEPESGTTYDKATGILSVNLTKLNVLLTEPPNVILPGVPDTNSEDPVFDEGNQNILLAGANDIDMANLRAALRTGDIAVYETPTGGYTIHRIVQIDRDEVGRFYRFAGDNNAGIVDSQIVRAGDIKFVSIGTIY